jgi:hypothetical protein
MTNASHKDSINSYTSPDDLIPRYSFEDLPSERDYKNDIVTSILAILFSVITLAVNLLLLLSPFILVGIIFHYLSFFNKW